jgi:outer membrane protein TolC
LASQTARIGVVTAELYPQFNIAGDFTMLTTSTSDMGDWDNRDWAFGGIFRWNLFDGGRVRGQIEVEDARTEQLLQRYEQTVLDALEEVETSMSDYVREQQRRESLGKSVFAAEESVRLVLILYRTGLTDFQNVLDMQRSLFEQQDQFADSEGTLTSNLISIYTALGGGWDPADLPELE